MTTTVETDRIEELRAKADAARFELAESRTALVHTIAEMSTIASNVRDGRTDRCSEIPDLQAAKERLQQTITTQEQELTALKAELERLQKAADKAALDRLFERMQSRRERIITLAREMSLELGRLQSEDRAEGSNLVPMHTGSPTQERFVELLSPINWSSDRTWAGSHVDINCGREYAVLIHAMKKL